MHIDAQIKSRTRFRAWPCARVGWRASQHLS